MVVEDVRVYPEGETVTKKFVIISLPGYINNIFGNPLGINKGESLILNPELKEPNIQLLLLKGAIMQVGSYKYNRKMFDRFMKGKTEYGGRDLGELNLKELKVIAGNLAKKLNITDKSKFTDRSSVVLIKEIKEMRKQEK